MKKGILVLVVLLFLVGSTSLFAAGQDGAGAVTEIKILSPIGAYQVMFRELVEEFNDTIGKEKGIHVTETTHIDDYLQVLELAFQSGEVPEIVTPISGMIVKHYRQGNIVPYADLPGWEQEIERFEPYSESLINIIDGEIVSLPFNVLTYKLCYNKDLFRKAGIVDASGEPTPPKTWAEVIEYAKRITDAGDGKEYGIMWCQKFVIWADWNIFKPFVPSIGNDYFNQKTGRYDFSSFKPALEFMMKIKEDGSYFPGPEGLDIDPARAQFSEGVAGMYFGLTFDVGVFNDQFPAKMDWGVTDLPVIDPNNRYKEPMISRGIFVASSSAMEDDAKARAAGEFLKFWHSDEVMRRLYGEGYIVPYKPEIIALPGKNTEKTGWKQFSDISKGYIQGIPPDGAIRLEGLTREQVVRKIWSGEMSIDEGLADLDQRHNAALDKAVEEGKVDLSLYQNPDFDIRIK
jgi:multiple sugar transport system substrate-binding protein